VYATLLVTGSVLAATAQDPGMYIAGHVLQGACTSLLLISAVPPLAIGYPASKLRTTAMIMNLCIFGAVALGPAIGGLQAQSDAWRPLFWAIAAIAACALLLAVLTFDDAPAADPESPIDPLAIALAVVGCGDSKQAQDAKAMADKAAATAKDAADKAATAAKDAGTAAMQAGTSAADATKAAGAAAMDSAKASGSDAMKSSAPAPAPAPAPSDTMKK